MFGVALLAALYVGFFQGWHTWTPEEAAERNRKREERKQRRAAIREHRAHAHARACAGEDDHSMLQDVVALLEAGGPPPNTDEAKRLQWRLSA